MHLLEDILIIYASFLLTSVDIDDIIDLLSTLGVISSFICLLGLILVLLYNNGNGSWRCLRKEILSTDKSNIAISLRSRNSSATQGQNIQPLTTFILLWETPMGLYGNWVFM